MAKHVVIFAGISLLIGFPCSAATITVDPNGSADYTTIQAGINAASNGDTVLVSDGTYIGSGNRDIDFLGKAITVKSANGPENCIINCQNSGRGFYFHNSEGPTSVVDGFTITNGYATKGGGIYGTSSCSPTIINCIISGNSADYGGGICFFSWVAPSNSFANIINCTISNNVSGKYGCGGGGYFSGTRPTFNDCIITNNQSSSLGNGGGGLYCDFYSHLTIRNCIISNNKIKGSQYAGGGGISCGYSNPDIYNCIITGNSALPGYGGGIDCSLFSSPKIVNCLIINNIASDGGALSSNTSSNPTLTNTIVWNNYGGEIDGLATVEYCDIQGGFPGTGNIDADPIFVGEDDYHLLPWSPCIDAGTNNPTGGLPPEDLDGQFRPMDGDNDGQAVADMGVYESLISSIPVIGLSDLNFYFSALLDGTDPEVQVLEIRNRGLGIINWEINYTECDWLNVDPTSGNSEGEPNDVTLSVDISGLGWGIYNCPLTVSDPCAMNNPQLVNVTLDITGPIIELSSSEFEFYADIDGQNPEDQVLTIRNSGGSTLNWEITETCDWLEVYPTSGSSAGEPNDVTLSVDISGLGWGEYNCQLTISDPNAMNSPKYVDVNLDITGPIIELSSTEFVFAAGAYGPNPDDQMLTIRNSGGGTLYWEISETCDWLTIYPTSGSSTGEPNDVTLNVDTSGLEGGVYDCPLTVSDPYAMNNPQIVSITLYFKGVIYVKDGGTGSGTSWADAYGDLQYALDDSDPNYVIWVAAGTYKPTLLFDPCDPRTAVFQMKNGVAIYGGFPNFGDPGMADRNPNQYETILSGDLLVNDNPNTPAEDLLNDPNRADNCYHVFYHPDGTNLDPDSILDGFFITGGNADGSGYHANGGGMLNYYYNSPTVTNCTFSGNSSKFDGGGLYNWLSSPKVTNCIFSGNSAGEFGGGIFNYDESNPTVTNCIFSGNTAYNGGGIYNHNDEWNNFLKVINCTFSGNSAGEHGGGICNWGEHDPNVYNCILWGNTASEGPQIYDSGASSPTVTYCDVQGGYTGTGNIDADPLFADPDGLDNVAGTEDDNLRLLPGSPCIDAGNNAAVPSDTPDLDGDGDQNEPIPWDLDRHNRFVDDPNTVDTGVGTPPIVDMGAYERGICGDADHPYPIGDTNRDCEVDIIDAVILALAWLSEDGGIGWNPDCNLYGADSIIDASDFAVMGQHWLECTKPECD